MDLQNELPMNNRWKWKMDIVINHIVDEANKRMFKNIIRKSAEEAIKNININPRRYGNVSIEQLTDFVRDFINRENKLGYKIN